MDLRVAGSRPVIRPMFLYLIADKIIAVGVIINAIFNKWLFFLNKCYEFNII